MTDTFPALAVSSWSVHHALGIMHPDSPERAFDGVADQAFGPAQLDILDLPGKIKAMGINRLELCHFHLAGRDPAYLREARSALHDAGVILQTLLIDDGDITSAAHGERDIAWISSWIDAAAELGAEKARVIGGKGEPTPENLDRAAQALMDLGQRGLKAGVRVITENWFDTLSTSAHVEHVLRPLNGHVGFLADTGNWSGDAKFSELASIFRHAENCHAKAHFDAADQMDEADFAQCLGAAAMAGYSGPYTLIYEGPGDEWQGLAREAAFIRRYFSKAP
jgi:sugar phosphate isomerase/epimerase